MAIRHFPDLDPGPAAKAIVVAWHRYSRVRLANDRRRGETTACAGTLAADLFELARLDGPPGQRSVRNILTAAKQTDAA
jgi:hypothetical protein